MPSENHPCKTRLHRLVKVVSFVAEAIEMPPGLTRVIEVSATLALCLTGILSN